MKDKHIKLLTALGLLAILALQSIWLVTTYHLTREEVTRRSDEIFRDAMMTEVFMRINILKEGMDVKYDAVGELDEEAAPGRSEDELLMSVVRAAMQEALQDKYHLPLSLTALDSIYTEKLHQSGLDAEVVCHLTDSLGNIRQSSKKSISSHYGVVKTSIHHISKDKQQNLQAIIVNPYAIIIQRMAMLLLATALMMAFVGYCIIYQIKMIARQNKIAKLREDFSYAMIHDMKTPLSSILMGVQILETGKLDSQPEKRAKYFHILKDEGEHLLALTNKVLTLSKLENHQLKLASESFELRPMLNDLIEMFTAKSPKPVTFTLQLDVETVWGDEEFIKEAISNLIDNSIKYSGALVDICISSLLEADSFYVIQVRDNGLGIPLRDQSRIFEKYERASAAVHSRKGGASGFGLGLNYVLRIVEAHGGKVRVESIEGDYSEFSLFLPQEDKKEKKI